MSSVVLAAAAYYNWSPEFYSMEMAFAANTPRFATPRTIGMFLKYPFVDCGCLRVTFIVRRSNKRVRRFLKGIGAVEEGRVRYGLYPDHAMIYGMLADEAQPWIAYVDDTFGVADAA